MSEAVPAGIADLLAQRAAARAARDFARADELRARIEAAGYVVHDAASGSTAERRAAFNPVDAAAIHSVLDQPASLGFSFHLLYEGYLEDLVRFLDGFTAHTAREDVEVVVVEQASPDAELVSEVVARYPHARVVHLRADVGWAGARNAGLKTSLGRIVALVDLSIEPTGGLCSPLEEAFSDASVAVAGPFGLVSEDMRNWHEDPGPEVDAIEGYLLATRRELLAGGLIHERFRWYRNADIDLSFQLRANGGRAIVVPMPLRKHVHRGWDSLDEQDRLIRSRRNHYTFFDRWKRREDLLTRRR